MRRVLLGTTGLVVTTLIAMVLMAWAVPVGHAVSTHASPLAVPPVPAHAPLAAAVGNASALATFTNSFSIGVSPYYVLPINVTWTEVMTNATITGANPSNTSYSGGNLTMFLNVTFSGIQTIGKVYNGSDAASCASATKCSFYHVIATGDLLAGFGLTGRDQLPTGQYIFTISSVATNQSATVQNYTVSTIQASSNLAPHQAFGQFSSPLGTWSAGTLTIAGNYSGTYLTGATVTVFNASKGVVFSDGVFSAAPNREYAFAVAWTVTLAGTYGLVLTLTEQWGATLNFTVNTTVTAATPSSHTYSNSTWGIDGLGPGGS
ncbi:MAG: hypothetical protein WCB19_03780, partial [Thermoplasmata archaeon]